ncbi:MAG: hypothetical protein E6767_09410 [Dysgonomonas sp.]|nr:hypothetical protein [Dysgonomonas sp.]
MMKNCFSVQQFVLSGRYIETQRKGLIMARQIEASGEEYYTLALPLRGYQSVTVEEKSVFRSDLNESAFPWGRDLISLTLNNMRSFEPPVLNNLKNLTINGISEGQNNLTLNQNINLDNLVIDVPETGANFHKVNFNHFAKNMLLKSMPCSGQTGSEFILQGTARIPGLILDLPENYRPAQICVYEYYGFPFTDLVWIIRSKTLIPLTGSRIDQLIHYLRAIYVPDELVEDYKKATNWYMFASKFYPLSSYE